MSRPRAYLAGPEVFLADAAAIITAFGDRLGAAVVRFGLAAPT